MSSVFTVSYPVRFADCDPAGIAFYPRLMEMGNNLVEEWFDRALDLSFRRMHLDGDIGVPTVHLEVDFRRPAQLGFSLEWTLRVIELGQTSVRLRLQARDAAGRLILEIRPKLVLCDMTGDEPTSRVIPELLRARMQEYTETSG